MLQHLQILNSFTVLVENTLKTAEMISNLLIIVIHERKKSHKRVDLFEYSCEAKLKIHLLVYKNV